MIKKPLKKWIWKNIITCIFITMFFLIDPPLAKSANYVALKHLFDIEGNKIKFNQPSDIKVKNGKIYVLDGVNNRIVVFNSKGEQLSSFGRQGKGTNNINYPLGMDIDNEKKLFVADSLNHRIVVFGTEGNYLYQFDLPAGTKPADPTALVIDEKNDRCLIVDNDNHRILVYSKKGKLQFKWGSKGRDIGEFRYPFSIALDNQQNVYIVDVLNSRVQILDPEGKFVRQIGDFGIAEGSLYRPKGIAIDKEGRVYISDSYFGIIQVFNKYGEFLYLTGKSNREPFNTPGRMFIDEHNRLYIVEMLSNKIGVYSIE